MLLNTRTTRSLLESAELAGLARSDLIAPIGLTEAELVDEDAKVSWDTVVLLLERLSTLVDGDPARLRTIGQRMSFAPSYMRVRRIAAAVVSARALYDMALRWIAPANFPHLPLVRTWRPDGRLALTGGIPEPFAASKAFFHVFEGNLMALPTLIGLQPAVITDSEITPRTFRIVVELPPADTLLSRVRRGVRALAGARGALSVLEQQRDELSEHVVALQRARDELRAVLERLPDLVVVQAAERIVWVNRAFTQATGYELAEIVGKPVIAIIAERSRPVVLARMRQSPDAPGQSAFAEVVWQTRAGREVIVEVALAQHVVFGGAPARLVVGRDITERTLMQQRLLVADRLASVGLLAAGVAHEVNNPLAYVLNNIEIARKELLGLGENAEKSLHVLSVALEGVDRIRSIVRDLLMLSRGDDGSVQAIDLRVIAESTLALAAHDIERTAELIQEYHPAPMVLASQARIAQVLLNLVANALEAMRDRPRADNRLCVRITRAADDRLLLEVSDTGVGITEVDRARLFEPFFTTKPAGQGTGLGLSIVQRLVVELGGEISVISKGGHGTTFRVLFPPAPPIS